MKAGLLLALGFGLATLVDNKDEAGKFVQGVGVGMATTQGMALLKEVIDPKEGIMKTAMGSPAEVVVVHDNSFAPPALESNYYDENDQVNFLAGVTQENFANMMM